jgi:hypothetical protein
LKWETLPYDHATPSSLKLGVVGESYWGRREGDGGRGGGAKRMATTMVEPGAVWEKGGGGRTMTTVV